jgi:O-antigen/teichoic acid export membrane protein
MNRSGALRSDSSRATFAVLAGSLTSGLAVYAFQAVAARSLGETAYAPISVLWTIQSIAMMVPLLAAETHIARESALHGEDAAVVRAVARRWSGWIVVIALVVGVVSSVWRRALFGGDSWSLPVIAAITILTYGAFMVIRGVLAGSERFSAYGVVTGVESLARFAAAVPLTVLAPTTTAFAWTFPVGPLPVLAWWVRRRRTDDDHVRTQAAAPAPAGTSTGRYLAATSVANGAGQTLLAAGPIALIPLGASPAEISTFFVTITLARVPLVFAFGGLLSRILPPLTLLAQERDLARLRAIAVGVGVGTTAAAAVAAIVARWMGPPLVAFLFGAGFRPDGWLASAAAGGVVVATGCLVLNQVLIALNAEQRLVLPWLAALGVGSAVVAVAPLDPVAAVAVGLVCGELVALAGLAGISLSCTAVQDAHSDEAVGRSSQSSDSTDSTDTPM